MAIELEGVAELSRKLKDLGNPKEIRTTLKSSLRKSMRPVLAAAQANVAIVSPGKTGMHKTHKGNTVFAGFASRSLRVDIRVARDGNTVSAVLGVLPEAFYAISFFELGTAKIPRRPWLVPAFDSQKSAALRGLGDELRKRVERIAKKRSAGK